MTNNNDIGDRLEAAVSAYVLAGMPPEPTGELAKKPMRDLLHIYANWRARNPGPRVRTVHMSAEMAASQQLQNFKPEVDALVEKLKRGDDIRPHLSRDSPTAYLTDADRQARPRHRRETDLDRMLADAGIHHLHLSGTVESDEFVKRGDELLFAIFTRTDVYLIGIYGHGDWFHDDLAPIIIRNWPGVGPYRKLNGLRPLQQQTAEKRKRDRKAGLTGGGVEVDGDWYVALGQTLAGTSILQNGPIMAIGEQIRRLRADPDGYLADILSDWQAQLDHPITGDWEPYVADGIIGLRRGNDVAKLGEIPGEV